MWWVFGYIVLIFIALPLVGRGVRWIEEGESVRAGAMYAWVVFLSIFWPVAIVLALIMLAIGGGVTGYEKLQRSNYSTSMRIMADKYILGKK